MLLILLEWKEEKGDDELQQLEAKVLQQISADVVKFPKDSMIMHHLFQFAFF